MTAIDTVEPGIDTALTLVRRAQDCRTLADLQYLLVNDLALLLPADRTALILRRGAGFHLVAIGGQVEVDRRSPFVRTLMPALADLPGSREIGLAALAGRCRGISETTRERLDRFLRREQLGVMLYLPLVHQEVVVGGLLFFYGRTQPPRAEAVQPLAEIAPTLAAALERELLLARSPRTRRERERLRGVRPAPLSRWHWWALLLAGLVLLLLPVPFKVAGQARLEPCRFHFCYSGLTAPVSQVLVRQGDRVERGQVLARLDDRDLSYAQRRARRELDRLETEIQILRNASAADRERTWELDLALLRRDLAAGEVAFLAQKRARLELTAPVTGLVVTEKLQSLRGRRFRAGEAFCRIVPTEELDVVVEVPESDAGYLEEGMPMVVIFAADPEGQLELRVEGISPLAEPAAGRGNQVAVRAPYRGGSPLLKPGMGGVGRIRVGRRPLAFVLFRRLWQRVRDLWLLL